MRQAADKRVRDFFGEQGPYSEPGQEVNAAGAGTTPPEASRVGDYMDQLNALGAQGGMAAMPTVVRGLTSMNNTLTKYEQPREVDGSLMSSSGEVLGTAPVRDPYRQGDGNIYSTTTGESAVSAAEVARQAQNQPYADIRVSELGARKGLADERSATERSKQAFSEAKISKILAEIEAGFQKGGGREGATLQLDRLYGLLNNPEATEESKGRIWKWITRIESAQASMKQADEATKGDGTEEGSASNTAEGTTVASHKTGLQTSQTGQVYDYVPGQGLRPR
jgi:hypothetical protein